MKIDKRPKIIISSYDDTKNPFYGGGGSYVVHEIAKRMIPAFKVTVLTGKYPNSKDELIDGVIYKRIGIGVNNPKLGQLFFYLSLFIAIKKYKFDIWMESFTPPFGTNCLQLFTDKPVVGLVYMLVGEDMKRKYKLRFDLIEKLGISTYRFLISPTESIKSKILQMNYSNTITVIPHGMDFDKITRKKYEKRKHLLFIGRTEINQKGLDLLLSAFDMLPHDFKYNLIIAGSGITSEVDVLKKRIDSMNLHNKIKIIGKVSGKEKERLFNEAIVTLIPSRFETFSVVALESLTYGVPIISFDIDGLKWVPKESCSRIPAFNTELFSKEIVKLCTNATTRKGMSDYGIKYSHKYTWESVSNQYIDYIKSIL